MRYEIRGATLAHAMVIADNPRPADVLELWASGRQTPFGAMEYGIEASSMAMTGLVDGQPVAMFGVVPASILSGIGAPWMVGAVDLEQHQFWFAKSSRPCVQRMQREFNVLANWVDNRNTLSKRWLRWLGFHVGQPQPFGSGGEPFCPFVWSEQMRASGYV